MTSASVTALTKTLQDGMLQTKTWQPDCPVPCERLSVVNIRYLDFNGVEHDDGELVALDVAAGYIRDAFDTLFQLRFPIERVRSVHHYGGDDNLSMADNNTSCFCHRPIEGTPLASLHSYGLAVDINPLQNPFVMFDEEKGTASIHPSQGWQYLNRANRKNGMVESLVDLWAEYGFFIWGGSWTTPIDYHHFQTPRGTAEMLMQMTPDDGERFFDVCIANRNKLRTGMPSGEKLQPFIELYHESSRKFFETFIDTLFKY